MNTPGQPPADGMDPLKDDPNLWDVLGRATPPAPVSPYFARRVLREIVLDEEATCGGRWWQSLWPLRLPAPRYLAACTGAFACAVLGLATLVNQPQIHRHAFTSSSATALAATPVGEQDAAATLDAAAARSSDEDATAASTSSPTAEVGDAAQDVEVIADLDNILDREESRLWTEDTARF